MYASTHTYVSVLGISLVLVTSILLNQVTKSSESSAISLPKVLI